MSDQPDFSDLLARVRRGDAAAAAQLVQQYEVELRVIIRARLRDPRLRRTLDTMDICQSVLGNFFARAAAGQFDLNAPEQLVKLLAQMVRNKVTDQARRATADRRDAGRLTADDVGNLPAACRDTPSQVVAAEELASRFQAQLNDDERSVQRLRQQGQTWEEIAAARQISPEALRKSFHRALDRAAEVVGLGE